MISFLRATQCPRTVSVERVVSTMDVQGNKISRESADNLTAVLQRWRYTDSGFILAH